MTTRRELIILLGGAVASPVGAWGQQSLPTVGFLNTPKPETFLDRVQAFRQGLEEMGFTEGESVRIEQRWANSDYSKLPDLARDLVESKVSVIAAGGMPPAMAAKGATASIPIVFVIGEDPVAAGLVASLNRPGGNLTGVARLATELGPKRLELLHEIVPDARTLGLLVNPTNANAQRQTRAMQKAGKTLGVGIQVLRASAEAEFETAFQSISQLQVGAIVIDNDGLFISHTEQLAALSVSHAVPAIFQFRKFSVAGGLISYGSSFTDPYRKLGRYAGRILKGENPTTLPVEQSSKVELIINLKTAKRLGLTIPLALLGRADEVIE